MGCREMDFERLYAENLKLIRNELKKRRDTALRCLEAYFGGIARWEKPRGGFYIWVTFLKPLAISALFEKALKKNILINPGTLYDKEAKHQAVLFLRFSIRPRKRDSNRR